MKRLLLGLIGFCLLPFALYATYGIGLWAMGYELGLSPEKLAEKLIEEKRPASDCDLFRTIDLLMRPTTDELQARCIRVYARLTKDPSACELLMPSSYGLSCVGAAEDSEPCVMLADGKKSVGGQGIDTTYDQCLTGAPATRKHVCCVMAEVMHGTKQNCDNFPKGELRDQCHHIVGVRMKKIEECSFIENERNRTGCEVVVRAYLTGRL